MRRTETERGVLRQRVPTTAGPDEPTVQLRRKDFRRHHRSRRNLRSRWRPVVVAVLVVALLGAGVWALFFSPHLTARGVEVVGAGEVGDLRVERAVELPSSVPLARLDVDGIRERVEAIPDVRRAEVSRSWPHTVRVQVVPREPLAVVTGGSGLQALDAEGVRFGSFDSAPRGLPEVRLADDLGGASATDVVAEAAAVVAALPGDVARRVGVVEAGSLDEIALVLGNGRRVVWGSAEQSETKAEVLQVLLAEIPRGVRQVDVSVPARPTTS